MAGDGDERPAYKWWKLEDLDGFLDALTAADPEYIRIEFHPEDTGEELVVVNTQLDSHDPFNSVHTCPPDCP